MKIEHPVLRPWTPADSIDTIIWWRGGDDLRFDRVARTIEVDGRIIPTTVEWGPVEHAYVRVDGAESMDRLAIEFLRYTSALTRSYYLYGMSTSDVVSALRAVQQTEGYLWGPDGTPVRPIASIVQQILDPKRVRSTLGE